MSTSFSDQAFPRGALIAVATLILFSLASVVAVQSFSKRSNSLLPASPSEVRDLQFVDHEGGTVTVRDNESREVITTLEPGTENFIRGVLRGLARERRAAGWGTSPPFRLARHRNGDLTLEDQATGRVIYLNAFGPTNAGAFERLLKAPMHAS
jgi:putative photosynthetic complex assembly protein